MYLILHALIFTSCGSQFLLQVATAFVLWAVISQIFEILWILVVNQSASGSPDFLGSPILNPVLNTDLRMNITPPFLVLLACTPMADAARQLTLDINGPSTNDIESLEIATILTNNGNESVNVLKEPLSPLSQLPANTFSFESEGAGQLSFVGIKAKFCDTRGWPIYQRCS
ncbi:hypothetical protein BKA70DRAFT_861385 [Coprinopsis sp. MPI-PUGE-AT-0042]|nr:hypothetical protein BKA70DRAFT_861385 [Coprinopsis sp. MPI-PUGE-AT-0042]